MPHVILPTLISAAHAAVLPQHLHFHYTSLHSSHRLCSPFPVPHILPHRLPISPAPVSKQSQPVQRWIMPSKTAWRVTPIAELIRVSSIIMYLMAPGYYRHGPPLYMLSKMSSWVITDPQIFTNNALQRTFHLIHFRIIDVSFATSVIFWNSNHVMPCCYTSKSRGHHHTPNTVLPPDHLLHAKTSEGLTRHKHLPKQWLCPTLILNHWPSAMRSELKDQSV